MRRIGDAADDELPSVQPGRPDNAGYENLITLCVAMRRRRRHNGTRRHADPGDRDLCFRDVAGVGARRMRLAGERPAVIRDETEVLIASLYHNPLVGRELEWNVARRQRRVGVALVALLTDADEFCARP